MSDLSLLVRRVRNTISDVDEPVRYSDQNIADALTMAFHAIWRMRPDARLMRGPVRFQSTLGFTASDLTGPFPLDYVFFEPAVLLTIGHLEMQEDQLADNQRAAAMVAKAEQMLQGG